MVPISAALFPEELFAVAVLEALPPMHAFT